MLVIKETKISDFMSTCNNTAIFHVSAADWTPVINLSLIDNNYTSKPASHCSVLR